MPKGAERSEKLSLVAQLTVGERGKGARGSEVQGLQVAAKGTRGECVDRVHGNDAFVGTKTLGSRENRGTKGEERSHKAPRTREEEL
jgi:hypothetical protein